MLEWDTLCSKKQCSTSGAHGALQTRHPNETRILELSRISGAPPRKIAVLRHAWDTCVEMSSYC
jgi:hypothetical protein